MMVVKSGLRMNAGSIGFPDGREVRKLVTTDIELRRDWLIERIIESLTHGLSCGFAFRVLEGIGERFQLAIGHAKRPARVAPAGDDAFYFAKDFPGTRRRNAEIGDDG